MNFVTNLTTLRLWLIQALAAIVAMITNTKASAVAEANTYTNAVAGSAKKDIATLQEEQSATRAIVENLAVYATNTQVRPYDIADGDATLGSIIGTIPSEKACFIIPVTGKDKNTATVTDSNGNALVVDNGDALYVNTEKGAVITVRHSNDRTSDMAATLNAKIDSTFDGVTDELALWKAQLEATIPGLVLA